MASRSQPISFVRQAVLDVAAHSALKVALTRQRPCRPTHTQPVTSGRGWEERRHHEAWPDSSSSFLSSTASSFNHVFHILMIRPAAPVGLAAHLTLCLQPSTETAAGSDLPQKPAGLIVPSNSSHSFW